MFVFLQDWAAAVVSKLGLCSGRIPVLHGQRRGLAVTGHTKCPRCMMFLTWGLFPWSLVVSVVPSLRSVVKSMRVSSYLLNIMYVLGD